MVSSYIMGVWEETVGQTNLTEEDRERNRMARKRFLEPDSPSNSRSSRNYDLDTLKRVESILFSKDALPPTEESSRLKLKEVQDLGFYLDNNFDGREGYIPPFLMARRQITDAIRQYASRSSTQIDMGL